MISWQKQLENEMAYQLENLMPIERVRLLSNLLAILPDDELQDVLKGLNRDKELIKLLRGIE